MLTSSTKAKKEISWQPTAEIIARDLNEAELKLKALRSDIESDAPSSAEAALSPRQDISKALRWFIPSDIVALLMGFVVAWAVASLINEAFFGRILTDTLAAESIASAAQFATIAAGTLLWLEHTSHYRVRMPFWLEAQKIVGTLTVAMMIDGFMYFASKQDFSRLWLVSRWGFAALALLVLRSLIRAALRRRGLWQVRTLLIGNGATAEEARVALQSEPSLGYKIVAQIDHIAGTFQKTGYSWTRLCTAHTADYVIIALDGHELSCSEDAMAPLMREAIPFSVSPPLRHLPVLGMDPQYFFNHDVMLMTRNNRLEQPLPRFIKRSFDVVVASTALIVLTPLLLALALFVKSDGGPAFFGQKRLGMNGKVFYCLKFRSMVVNNDQILKEYLASHPNIRAEWQSHKKLRFGDPRVTRAGKILRHGSFDELPQLWNVLKGEMSLVGPRPILLSELDEYGQDIAHYSRVRPGITGMWQVSGRNNVSYRRRVQIDSWYVRNWSLWHDLAILCKTIPVVLKRKGAF